MHPFSLDKSLVSVEAKTKDGKIAAQWTIRHAVEGVQIFGGIGSGKTSGSGRLLALNYLKAGFGGLVLTVKPDEKEAWQSYCKLAGRSKDLIILEPGGSHCFNFLEYEGRNPSGKQAITENIVEVLKTVIQAGEEKDSGKGDNAFWEKSLDMLLFNAIDLCKLAYDRVSVQDLYDIVLTSPRERKDLEKNKEERAASAFFRAFDKARTRVMGRIKAWEELASIGELHQMSDARYFDEQMGTHVPTYRVLKFLDQFFMDTQIKLNDKTRSIIEFMFLGFLYRLLREPIYSLFCRGTSTVTPEDCWQGKIILLNLPVKVYHKVGRDCQILFKYIWQRAMEKRLVEEQTRPVFLWADEAQNFLHEHDAAYQATARSSRIATVYISQNLPNYYASMSGISSDNRVKSFLGTLGTKIFHANADIETNEYASALIGEVEAEKHGDTISMGKEFSQSFSRHSELKRQVRPEEFARLKTGGSKSQAIVEGYLLWQGDTLLSGRNHLKMNFNQNQQ